MAIVTYPLAVLLMAAAGIAFSVGLGVLCCDVARYSWYQRLAREDRRTRRLPTVLYF